MRENPGTAAWFAPGASSLGARMSRTREVVEPLTAAFAATLAGGERTTESQLAARWAVRVIVSFLADPGGDEAEERALLERFVAPVLAGRVSPRVRP